VQASLGMVLIIVLQIVLIVVLVICRHKIEPDPNTLDTAAMPKSSST
jgi:hypothetical protein